MNSNPMGVHDDPKSVHDLSKVIEWLEQVRKLDELLKAKEAEREDLWTAATRITPNLDGMPHGSNTGDKVGNIAVKLAQLMDDTNAAWDEYLDMKTRVIAVLEQLPAKEYGVLHREYIQYKTHVQIAEEMHYSTMQIWRIKQSGLKMLWHVIPQ